MCMHRPPLIVAGLLFTIIALAHLIRYFVGWALIVETFAIPLSWSLVAVVVSGILAFWMFAAACSNHGTSNE